MSLIIQFGHKHICTLVRTIEPNPNKTQIHNAINIVAHIETFVALDMNRCRISSSKWHTIYFVAQLSFTRHFKIRTDADII